MIWAILAAYAVAYAFLHIRKPYLARLLYILSIPLFLIKIPIGPIPLNIFEIIVIEGFLFTLYTEKPRIRLPKQLLIAILFLCIGVGLSTHGALHLTSALGAIKGFILIPAIFAYTLHLFIKRTGARSWILSCITWMTSLVCIASLSMSYFADKLLIDGRLSWPFESANYLAMLLSPSLIIASYLYLNYHGKHKREWMMVIFLHAICLLLTQSYGAWIGLAIAGSYLLYKELKTHRKTVLIGILLLGVTAAALIYPTDKFQQLLSSRSYSQATTRGEIWQISHHLIKHYPLTGIGLRQFDGPDAHPERSHWDASATEILGHAPMDTEVLHPHNLFLATYLFIGPLGLLGLLLLLWFFFKHASKEYHSVLIASYLYYLGHGLVDTPLFKNDLASIFLLISITTLALVVEKESDHIKKEYARYKHMK